MKSENLSAVRARARDLRREPPRGPNLELGGYPLAARTLDKCRASLVGWGGEYEFNCPLDQEFFALTGIEAEAFREFVATGADDAAIGEWIREHSQGPPS